MASNSPCGNSMELERFRAGSCQENGPIVGTWDAYADLKQNIERLTIQRDNIARDIAQVVAFEAELEQLQNTMKEQVNLLT